MTNARRYGFASTAVIGALAVAGCGSSHAGSSTTAAPVAVAPFTTTAATSAAPTTASTTTETPATPTAATPTAPVKLSNAETVALKRACGYFSGDVGALTGELKMSNLTASQLREAARYVAQDLTAFGPALGGSPGAEFTSVRRVVAAAANAGAASSHELSVVAGTFGSPAFAALNRSFTAACRSHLR